MLDFDSPASQMQAKIRQQVVNKERLSKAKSTDIWFFEKTAWGISAADSQFYRDFGDTRR